MGHLAELWIEGLRCIGSAQLELSPRSNLLYGANGAGKTSVLEAAFLLGRGYSFRTRLNERVIQAGRDGCVVRGRIVGDAVEHSVGLEIARNAPTRARIDHQTPSSLAELARVFPVQVLDPDVHRLIEEGPSVRRRWLDWLVFHVEPGFADVWARYQRALRQRNVALRAGQADLEPWDFQVAQEGERLAGLRSAAFGRLSSGWLALADAMLDLPIELDLQQGWESALSLGEALARSTRRDRERGVTTVGPHRAEVAVKAAGRPAREVLSRGQQKVAGAALVLLQLEHLQRELGIVPTLLVDDPSAELDQVRLERLIARIAGLGAQLVTTALTREFSLFGSPDKVFHVERGGVETI